jgi:hypothetical protein
MLGAAGMLFTLVYFGQQEYHKTPDNAIEQPDSTTDEH